MAGRQNYVLYFVTKKNIVNSCKSGQLMSRFNVVAFGDVVFGDFFSNFFFCLYGHRRMCLGLHKCSSVAYCIVMRGSYNCRNSNNCRFVQL